MQDNNIRYVALNTLARVVGVDTQAVQRHRATVVACVKDADVSIRRRALELVYALVNQSNIQALITELLDYLKVCPRRAYAPPPTSSLPRFTNAQIVYQRGPNRSPRNHMLSGLSCLVAVHATRASVRQESLTNIRVSP